jgi:endonuclease/exonuclease/phosphatase family metal-dependent hydrolase
MRRIRLPTLCGALLLAAACNDTSPVGPAATSGRPVQDNGRLTDEAWYGNAGPGAMPIRVYQQNAYPGFNIDLVVAAIPQGGEAFLQALAVGLLTFDYTNWRERAARMVAEIRRQDPDVVSLNEMITLERQGLELLNLPVPDGKTDFLGVFEEELAKAGLHYKVVDSLPLSDALINLVPDLVFARYQDRDALLVREDVGVANVTVDTFAVELSVPPVSQIRGWIAADLTVRGKTWHFIESHPDPSWPANGDSTHIQQLLGSVAAVTVPVILAGDLNLLPTSGTYDTLTAAGFVDLWTRRLGPAPAGNPDGLTCCQADSLDNATSALVKRIDYVVARPASGYRVGPVRFTIFGDDLSERTATGLWPADHTGLLVGLVMQHK